MTIYDALKLKLGREPLPAELAAECKRIIAEGYANVAAIGKLPHQRKR